MTITQLCFLVKFKWSFHIPLNTMSVWKVFVVLGGASGQSPVVEVTANTSLSARPPQYTIHRQLSQHTHLLIYTHTHAMYV